MGIEEIKKMLEEAKVEKKEEIIKQIEEEIAKERQKGIEESRKKNKEAENLRKFKQVVEELGWDGNTDLMEFVNNLQKTKEEAEKKTITLDNLQKQIEKIKSELNAERKAKEEYANKMKQEKIKNFIIDYLKDKAIGPDLIAQAFISKADADDNNFYFIKSENEKVDLKTELDNFLQQRKDLQLVKAPGGLGVPNGGQKINATADALRIQELRKLKNKLVY